MIFTYILVDNIQKWKKIYAFVAIPLNLILIECQLAVWKILKEFQLAVRKILNECQLPVKISQS